MRPIHIVLLLTLAAIWGGSYALMRITSPVLGGLGTAWVRIAIAGSALVLWALVTREELGFIKWGRQYLWLGLLNSAVPFALIAFAMKTLPANYGAVLNALSPLFAVCFAAWLLAEPLTRTKLAGIAIGFLGVAVLVRLGPVAISMELLTAAFCCVAATASYGYASVYTKQHLQTAPRMGLASGALLLPAVPLGFVAVPGLPMHWPGWPVVAAIGVLAFVCSALAYLIYFRLIRDLGPTKATSVTFLIPVFGTLWGVVFLDEVVTFTMLAGAALILAGMALVLGWPSLGSAKRA